MCRLDWSDDGVHGEVYAGTSGATTTATAPKATVTASDVVPVDFSGGVLDVLVDVVANETPWFSGEVDADCGCEGVTVVTSGSGVASVGMSASDGDGYC
ncbi:hypothetical protein PInf_004862 [Phytophthora infestans]|nr:hypothetical protein PInf_004862 [Phytophthora infestans]